MWHYCTWSTVTAYHKWAYTWRSKTFTHRTRLCMHSCSNLSLLTIDSLLPIIVHGAAFAYVTRVTWILQTRQNCWLLRWNFHRTTWDQRNFHIDTCWHETHHVLHAQPIDVPQTGRQYMVLCAHRIEPRAGAMIWYSSGEVLYALCTALYASRMHCTWCSITV